jgi:hypothetical protein
LGGKQELMQLLPLASWYTWGNICSGFLTGTGPELEIRSEDVSIDAYVNAKLKAGKIIMDGGMRP